MNQVSAKDLVGAYIAGNFGSMSSATVDKARPSNGTRNSDGSFDSIFKESIKTSQKFERKDDVKSAERHHDRNSPAISAKRKFEKDMRHELKVKEKDTKVENPDEIKNEKVAKNDEKPEKDVKVAKNDEKPEKDVKVEEQDKDVVEEVSAKATTTESVQKTDAVTNPEDKAKDTSKEDEAANQLLMLLSQALNVEPKELEKMLKESNIDLKDVIKEQKVDELGSFIAKTKVVGLEEEKKPEVKLNKDEKEIIKDILQKLKASTEDIKPQVVSEKKVQVEDLRDSKEFMKFLESKGTELKERLTTPKNDISKNEEIVTKSKEQPEESKVQTTLRESKPHDGNQQKQPEEENNVRAVAGSQTTTKDGQNDKISMQVVKEVLNEKSANAEKVTETKGIDMLSNNNNGGGKANQIASAQKVEQPNKLFRETIISQIIDKAKLTITNGKSEMSLELKPESLGKISMKIASENGTVVAKIVADSEQTKAVLESNVNQLKDTLENQGIKIQEFNISLASDKQNQNQNQQEAQNKGNPGENNKSKDSISRIRTSGGGTNAYESGNISANDIRNYYERKDSKVSYSA